jgi:predicted nucleic acid-binding protein
VSVVGLDTSVAIPLIVRAHEAHAELVRWWDRRQVALCGHAVVETYSVLTRLPGDIRLRPTDAALLIGERFGPGLPLSAAATLALPGTLAGLGVTGGAVYDALIGLAAVEHGVVLATRDLRARSTYEAVGAEVLVAG